MMWANHGMRFFEHHGWWWVFGGLVPFLLVLTLVGLGIWAILRATSRGPSGFYGAAPVGAAPSRSDSALEEVRLRYARGEMTREEFLQRSHDLGGGGPVHVQAPPAESPPAEPSGPPATA